MNTALYLGGQLPERHRLGARRLDASRRPRAVLHEIRVGVKPQRRVGDGGNHRGHGVAALRLVGGRHLLLATASVGVGRGSDASPQSKGKEER